MLSGESKLVCSGCPLLCDDVLYVNGEYYGMCKHGVERLELAKYMVNGRSSIEELVELLKKSRKPLVYGMGFSSIESIKYWFNVAKATGGVIALNTNSPTMLLYEYILEENFKMKLEDARDSSNFIMFIHTDPSSTCIRLMSRYLVFPRGSKAPEGRENRVVASIDYRETCASRIANYKFITSNTIEVLEAIAKSLTGSFKAPKGVPETRFRLMINDLKESSNPVIVVGLEGVSAEELEVYKNCIGRILEELRGIGLKPSLLPIPLTLSDPSITLVMKELKVKPPAYDYGESRVISLREAFEKTDLHIIVKIDPVLHLPIQFVYNYIRSPVFITEKPLVTMEVVKPKLAVQTQVLGVEEAGYVARVDYEIIDLKHIIKARENLPREVDVARKILEEVG